MKKKLLAALLSVLMIVTMASGVFAGYIIPGMNTIITGSNGTANIISDRWMYHQCPSCGYSWSVYYVLDGDVKYYCPSCEKQGIVVEGSDSDYDYCECGKDCDCKVYCSSCRRDVICGTMCGCGYIRYCPKNCSSCDNYWWNWGDPSANRCVCGPRCDCPVKCPICGEWGNCGEACMPCDQVLVCGRNCPYCSNSGCTRPDYGKYYSVTVTMADCGDYSITDGAYGKYGDTKTVTITPDYGYAVSDVVINGRSYGAMTEFDLNMITNYYVRVYFTKLNLWQKYTVKADFTGKGKITLVQNGTSIKDTSCVKATYADSLTYRFIPTNDNYYVKDVKVNGRSIGAKTSYTISKLKTDTTISVTFGWKCPYTDVSDSYLNAVEYVTEAGIMSSLNKYINTNLFKGTNRVSIKTFVTALAEMADVEDVLDTADDRVDWAIEAGLVKKDADLSKIVSVQNACKIMAKYLEVIEEENDITFTGIKSTTAKDICVELKLVSEAAYKQNSGITRYDLAGLCYAIHNLDYKD